MFSESAVGISVPQDQERLSGSDGQEKRWEMTGMDRQRRGESNDWPPFEETAFERH